MATTKIWPVRGKLGKVVLYAENPEKTCNPGYAYSEKELQNLCDVMDCAMESYNSSGADDNAIRDVMEYAKNEYKTDMQYFVSGVNCDAATAREQMMLTKRLYRKKGGIVAHHAYQSFKPGKVTPEIAHEIGVKLARELWGDRFEVLVCTHLNTQCVHNHFVINSVSFADGKKYYGNRENYHHFRSTSDRLCREYGLSVVKEPKGRSKAYAEWQAEQGGKPTLRGIIRQDVDRAIRESMTWSAFLNNLRKQGYTIKTGVKHLAVRPPGKDRFVRIRSLGEQYEEEAHPETARSFPLEAAHIYSKAHTLSRHIWVYPAQGHMEKPAGAILSLFADIERSTGAEPHRGARVFCYPGGHFKLSGASGTGILPAPPQI